MCQRIWILSTLSSPFPLLSSTWSHWYHHTPDPWYETSKKQTINPFSPACSSALLSDHGASTSLPTHSTYSNPPGWSRSLLHLRIAKKNILQCLLIDSRDRHWPRATQNLCWLAGSMHSLSLESYIPGRIWLASNCRTGRSQKSCESMTRTPSRWRLQSLDFAWWGYTLTYARPKRSFI